MTDDEARRCIETELERNILVEASAGSGKTEALARRMAEGLRRGTYQVEGLAAVTFTKQAASELRGRLQLKLEEALVGATGAERSNVERALSRLEHLFTGTIHGFCSQLLRERPVEAGLTPGFRELEHGEEALAMRSLHRYVDELRQSDRVDCLRDLAIGASELESTFFTLCQYSDVELPAKATPRPDIEPVRTAAAHFRDEMTQVFDRATRCRLQQQIRTLRGRLEVVPSNLGRLAAALAEAERESSVTLSWWGRGLEARSAADDASARLARFRAEVALPFLEAVRSWAYAPLLEILTGARAAFEEERCRNATLSFSDLLRLAAGLLREQGSVRDALAAKYRWVLVDEFQDTDPVQAEVLAALAAEPGQSGAWNQLRLRPGALFVVGDPKQSIYRFRRADISVYHAMRELIADPARGGGRVLSLTTSFRSRPEVCDWVNTVFRGLFPSELSDVQAPYVGLESALPPAPGSGVRLLSVPVESARAAGGADAAAVADWIASELRSGRRPGDFLILTRTKKAIPLYVAALGQRAVPVESVYAGVAGRVGITRAVLDLLRAVNDPGDPIGVVAVLRGQLFGCSDDELHRHVLGGGSFTPLPEGSGEPSVVAGLRRLHKMVTWGRERTPAAAVERILEETGALAWAAAESTGGTEAGVLLDLADRVRQATERGGGLSEAVAEMAAELGGARRDRPAWPLEPGRKDVVRVMNLHVSKGLEARVVVLADPAGGRVYPPDLRVVRHGERAQGYLQIASGASWARRLLAQPPDWAEHAAEEQRFQDAEQDRLLYVATTRARELLVVTRVEVTGGGKLEKPAWARLGPFTRGLGELSWNSVPEPASAPFDPGDGAEAARRRSERKALVRRPGWTRQAITAATEEGKPILGPALGRGARAPRDLAAAWGALVHRLLEQAVKPPAKSPEDLERLARWYCFESPELGDLIPDAVQVVLELLDSDYGRYVLETEHLAEVPFAVKRAHNALMFGVLDLAIKSREGWELVDYKTDPRQVDQLVELYSPQVLEYARAWSETTGQEVSYRGLYGVVTGELSDDLGPRGH